MLAHRFQEVYLMNAFSETMIDVVMESICFLIRCFHLLVVGLRPKLDPPSSAEDRSCLKIATCVKSTSLTLISNSNRNLDFRCELLLISEALYIGSHDSPSSTPYCHQHPPLKSAIYNIDLIQSALILFQSRISSYPYLLR